MLEQNVLPGKIATQVLLLIFAPLLDPVKEVSIDNQSIYFTFASKESLTLKFPFTVHVNTPQTTCLRPTLQSWLQRELMKQ